MLGTGTKSTGIQKFGIMNRRGTAMRKFTSTNTRTSRLAIRSSGMAHIIDVVNKSDNISLHPRDVAC